MQPHQEIDRRIEAIAAGVNSLVTRLRAAGFVFHNPKDVFPGVEADVELHVSRIEREIGPVPYALAAFWRRIGSVDLTGSHPNWTGCEYPDALFVYPASAAAAELDDFLADREYRLAIGFPFKIPIAPDSFHKENVSGGMWYNVDCPATDDNPIVNDEGRDLPFLDYVEDALRMGGFPGVRGDHNWPDS
ncbi:MAG TPA: hypothetical protein VEI07_09505 [Planctomycetaceae bacterium]|nr:hypothetical protein [Planctomycetaceae bacterium]